MHLSRLTRERHARYQNTYYHLEPNVKDGPGGLRDFQLVRWLARIRQAEDAGSPELREAFAFLARLRCYLHYWAGATATCSRSRRRNARRRSGERPTRRRGCASTSGTRARSRAPALRALETAEGQHSGLLSSFRDWRSRLSNAEFSVSRERVYLRSPQQLDADPDLALRAVRVRGAPRRPALGRGRAAHRATAAAPGRMVRARRAPCGPRCKRMFALPSLPAALQRHARDRRAGRDVSRVRRDRVPGGARLLPSLHRGRAHAGGDAATWWSCAGRASRRSCPNSRTLPRWCSRCCFTTWGRRSRTGRTWRARSRRWRRPCCGCRCRSATAKRCAS